MSSVHEMTTAEEDATTFKVVQSWLGEARVSESEYFFAVRDSYPVNLGHTLIVSKRAAATMLELTASEYSDLREIIGRVVNDIDAKFQPDGYNIGANCGRASGQTIMHFHLHVIPRYEGDVPDPAGGVRNIKRSLVTYHADCD